MKEFLEKASKAYYEGNPIISDEEFDELAKRYQFDNVGYSSDFKFYHLYPMYSLQKVYEGDKDPFQGIQANTVVSPKLDGAAISIRYSDGNLVLALTRGDGKKGLEITEKVATLVPNIISRAGEVQITGEIVCPKDIPNSRNLASGSLNLKDLGEFKTRPLTFIAYDVYPKRHTYWCEEMEWLKTQGFNTVLDSNWSEFPHDGQVFRIDNNEKYEEMGYTARHPRGAFAFKQRQKGVVTKLLDVVWKVGKSGVVSPVAILEPVLVGDAMVSRATLHNISYIESLELEIGCNVEIIRSGEIIPRILRKI